MEGGSGSSFSSEFKKPGKNSTTQKRIDKNLSIRKDKRSEKLGRNRIAVAKTETFAALFAKYNQKALLNGDKDQLFLLHQIIGLDGEEAAIEKHMLQLLAVPTNNKKVDFIVIRYLIELCKNNSPKFVERTRLAIKILLNLTGLETTSYDVAIANAIVSDGGFLKDVLPEHLRLWFLDKNQVLDNVAHSCLWEMVLNIILVCPEGKNEVFDSVLFAKGQLFNQTLRQVYNAKNHFMMATLLSVAFALADVEVWDFKLQIWPYVIHVLREITPTPFQSMNDITRITLRRCITITLLYLQKAEMIESQGVKLVAIAEPNIFLKVLEAHYKGCADSYLQVKILQIIALVTALPSDNYALQKWMNESGWIDLLMKSLDSTTAAIRQFAFICVGNYMSDGVVFVRELLARQILDVLIPAVTRDQAPIRKQAVYALMTMFDACNQDRNKMELAKHADLTMTLLVTQHKLFKYITPFIGLMNDHQVVCDVLRVIATALKWKREVALQALESTSADGRIDMLFSELERVKGSGESEVYQMAVMVDDLINGREPEANRRMEIEFDMPPPEGVMRGNFNF